MTRLFRNPRGYRSLTVLLAAVLMPLVFTVTHSLAVEATPGQSQPKTDEKIYITSDSLVTNNESKYAEFIGNVKATQGPDVMTSDKLRVYFKETPKGQESLTEGEESIEKIVANGHVVINFDNKVAVAEKAVYMTDTKILVLSGANSKVTSGKDTIAGEKITLYRVDGRINVERGTDKRVEAVFFSGKNKSNQTVNPEKK